MRLKPALIACALTLSPIAASAEGSASTEKTVALQGPIVPATVAASIGRLRDRADSLRKEGDYEAALAAYQSEIALAGESADRRQATRARYAPAADVDAEIAAHRRKRTQSPGGVK